MIKKLQIWVQNGGKIIKGIKNHKETHTTIAE